MTEIPKKTAYKDPRLAQVGAQFNALVSAARAANVPIPKSVPDAFCGLTDDERRILSLLQTRSTKRNEMRNATAPGTLDTVRRGAAEAQARRGGNRADADPSNADAETGQADAPNLLGSGAEPARPETRLDDDALACSGAGQDSAPLDNGAQPVRCVDDRDMRPTEAMIPSPIPKVPGRGRTEKPKPLEIRLPNGRVRQSYSLTADRPILTVKDDGGSGLSVDPDGKLSGTPHAAGDYMLSLEIADPDGTPRPASARLTVIADPRDLWVPKPSDRDDPYWKPDEAVHTAKGDAFLVAGSLRGRSHAQKGGFREDHCVVQVEQNRWHVLVVADGAGSAAMSRHASKVACETAAAALSRNVARYLCRPLKGRLAAWQADPDREIDSIRRDLFYPVLAGAAKEATHAIMAVATATGTPFRDYSTTILCAVARQTANGWIVGTFSVGDGGAVLFDAKAGEVEVLCSPDSGEYAGQTMFLAPAIFEDDRAVLSRIHCTIRPSFTAFVLMTDGIMDPFFPTYAVLADPETWGAFWTDELTPQVTLSPDNAGLRGQLIDWLGFWSKGNHDDRTIALLIPEHVA